MNINKVDIQSGEEYIEFVRKFVTLVDKQFSLWEERVSKGENINELESQIPALSDLTRVIAYLRGQDGVFLRFRPMTSNQQELYDYEDMFQERLEKLVKVVAINLINNTE